ncbi:A-Kinase Anchor Protein 1 [Manis pentadactyla]|nr:A-Kinase Anchor Protein 1 [Manis pentadactyla]
MTARCVSSSWHVEWWGAQVKQDYEKKTEVELPNTLLAGWKQQASFAANEKPICWGPEPANWLYSIESSSGSFFMLNCLT